MGRRSWLGFGIASVVLGCCCGCDYFRPAPPEPPSSEVSFVPDYSSPDSTLSTIAKAVAAKGHGIGGTAYAGAFADSVSGSIAAYHQFFWPQDVVDWSQLTGHLPPADWGFELERTFYTRLPQIRPEAYYMEWSVDRPNPDDVGADAATIHRKYIITAHATDGTRVAYLAFGFADLRLLRFSDGNWRIVKWDDRRDPSADPASQITFGRQRLNNTQ